LVVYIIVSRVYSNGTPGVLPTVYIFMTYLATLSVGQTITPSILLLIHCQTLCKERKVDLH